MVLHHCTLLCFTSRIHNGWGSTDDDYLFIQLPLIRFVIAGRPQVMIFFTISGYALSYKPLKLAHQHRYSELHHSLASSAFRRHSRLFIPVVAVTFATAIMSQLGWFGTYALGYVPQPWRQPPQHDSFVSQLLEWAKDSITISDFVSGNMSRGGAYDPNLWTIPMEFTCSLFIFLALLAFSKLKPSARLRLEMFIVSYCLYYAYWQILLFCGGMLLCDWNFYLTQIGSELTVSGSIMSFGPITHIWDKVVDKYCRLRHAVWTASFILSIHVLGMPAVGYGLAQSPGFQTLASLVPANYAGAPTDFWMSLGALWLILTVDRSPWLQKVFTMRLPQYLGKISFSLYLVHGPILYTLGWHLLKWCTAWSKDETNVQYGLGVCLAACGFWPAVIWIADFVTRRIDTPAVRFGQWAYNELLWKDSTDTAHLEMVLIGN